MIHFPEAQLILNRVCPHLLVPHIDN
jgi:hypothetical protein